MSSNSWDSWELKLLSIKDGVEKYSYRGWVLYYRGGIWYVAGDNGALLNTVSGAYDGCNKLREIQIMKHRKLKLERILDTNV